MYLLLLETDLVATLDLFVTVAYAWSPVQRLLVQAAVQSELQFHSAVTLFLVPPAQFPACHLKSHLSAEQSTLLHYPL